MQTSFGSFFTFLLIGAIAVMVDPGGGLGAVFLSITPVWAGIFLTCWFGVLLKRNFTAVNFLKYYFLSAVTGIVSANAVILALIMSIEGIERGFEEYIGVGEALRGDLRVPIIFLSVAVGFSFLFTSAAAFEKSGKGEDPTPAGEEP